MTMKVTIDLPEDAFTILRTDPANFVIEMRLAAIKSVQSTFRYLVA
jgi:hypothetical protein